MRYFSHYFQIQMCALSIHWVDLTTMFSAGRPPDSATKPIEYVIQMLRLTFFRHKVNGICKSEPFNIMDLNTISERSAAKKGVILYRIPWKRSKMFDLHRFTSPICAPAFLDADTSLRLSQRITDVDKRVAREARTWDTAARATVTRYAHVEPADFLRPRTRGIGEPRM